MSLGKRRERKEKEKKNKKGEESLVSFFID